MFVSRPTLLLAAFVLAFPLACGNDEGVPVDPSGSANAPAEAPAPELVCPSFDGAAFPEMAPLIIEKASYFSPLVGAFSVSSTGSPAYSIPIEEGAYRHKLESSLTMVAFPLLVCRVFLDVVQTSPKMIKFAALR